MTRLIRVLFIASICILLSLTFTCACAFTANSVANVEANTLRFNYGISGKHSMLMYPFSAIDTTPVFKPPSWLQIIEDEAFEGTAIVVVELPDSVESIGERAFANITSLLAVKIPDNTRVIAKNAFVGSDKVTITAAPGSYARTFARENGLPFAPIAVMTASTGNAQVLSASQTQRTRIDSATAGLDSSEDKTPRWRPVDEIHIEQYDQCIAHCIIGRAPPACA